MVARHGIATISLSELRKSQIRKAPPDFFKDFKAASTRG